MIVMPAQNPARRMKPRAADRDAILFHIKFRAKSGKLPAHGLNAVAFLIAQAARSRKFPVAAISGKRE